MAYSKGLHELGDGCFAYLQPDGGWGWSNAGLVVGGDVSLLVDTCHGPLTDKSGISQVRDYLVFVQDEATTRFNAGMDAWEAARDIALNGFAGWGEFGRISVNVDTVYRSLDPGHQRPNVIEQFKRMAQLEGHS